MSNNGETINGLALCSGIGGIDLGLSIALGGDYRTVCHVERDAFAAACLVARMEDAALDAAPVWDDLKTFDGRRWRGVVDIVTAGYPCQPFSLAGKRLGVLDERHLWPDVLRIIGEVQPGCVFLENVAAHLGMGYAEVERDLQGLGYRVGPGLFTAEEAGAPHGRKRLFILAYRDGSRREAWKHVSCADEEAESGISLRIDSVADACGAGPQRLTSNSAAQSNHGHLGRSGGTDLADTHRVNDAEPEAGWGNGARGVAARPGGELGYAYGDGRGEAFGGEAEGLGPFPPGPGASGEWSAVLTQHPHLAPAITKEEAESSVCPVVDGVSARMDQLRCLGNAVVPGVAGIAFVRLAAQLGIGLGEQQIRDAA